VVKATLETRVEMLEETVGGADGVSARLGRIETRLGHVETSLGHVETEVREFRGEFLQFRDETRAEFSAVRAEMATKQELAETRGQMRTLHDEVIGRLALLQEGRDAARTGTRRPRQKR